MTFPSKKRINRELAIDEKAELYIQKSEPNFLAKLEQSKNVGGKTNNKWD